MKFTKRERGVGEWRTEGWREGQGGLEGERERKGEKRAAATVVVTRWFASTALFRAYTSPVAAKCREIVILQSQREFTLAAGEI